MNTNSIAWASDGVLQPIALYDELVSPLRAGLLYLKNYKTFSRWIPLVFLVSWAKATAAFYDRTLFNLVDINPANTFIVPLADSLDPEGSYSVCEGLESEIESQAA